MLHTLIDTLITYFTSLGYTGIFFLMAMESSIFPVPSELVMIPAGIAAYSGNIDPYIATLVGGLGSLFGALLNYYVLGMYLGRPFLQKYGKYILITPEKYQKSEDLFTKNANIYTFLGRFIPVVRHIISIPAGIFQMRILAFSVLTFVGATIWCGMLVFFGYRYGTDVIAIVRDNAHTITYILVPCIAGYVVWQIFGTKSR